MLTKSEGKQMLEIRTETHNPRHRLVDVIPLQTPYVIFIDPSSVCNFKCKFCPSNNVLGDDGTVHNIMKMSTFEKVLSGMKMFPQKVKVVELYCIGEPLVNPDVPIMIKKLKNDYGGVCEVVRLTTIMAQFARQNFKTFIMN